MRGSINLIVEKDSDFTVSTISTRRECVNANTIK